MLGGRTFLPLFWAIQDFPFGGVCRIESSLFINDLLFYYLIVSDRYPAVDIIIRESGSEIATSNDASSGRNKKRRNKKRRKRRKRPQSGKKCFL